MKLDLKLVVKILCCLYPSGCTGTLGPMYCWPVLAMAEAGCGRFPVAIARPFRARTAATSAVPSCQMVRGARDYCLDLTIQLGPSFFLQVSTYAVVMKMEV